MGTLYLLAEYGRAKTVDFSLVEVDGVDLRVDAADGGDDIKIMKDEGAEASTTNNFTDEGQGYAVALTATELQAARVKGYIVDTATKVWLDTDFLIETFGHPSSAHPFLSPYWTNGAVNDGSASATVWTFDGFTEATADHVIGSELTFTSGANAGQCRTVTDYTSTVLTVSPAFLAAPADNDEFVLKARPTTSAGNVPGVDIAAILTDTGTTLDARIPTALVGLRMSSSIGNVQAGAMTSTGFATDAITAAKFAADTVDKIVDQAWDEARADHVSAGSFGQIGELIVTNGTVETSGSNSSTQVQTDLGEATNNHYNEGVILFTSGAEAGQYRTILDYVGSSGVISWDKALTGTPADSVTFVLVPAGTSVSAVWDEVLTGGTHNVSNSSGRRLRQIQEAGGYSGGAIYIDTVNGTTGTTDFENGVETKPAKNIADANTLASSLSLSKFVVSPGSSITFAASQENQEFIGENWDLALGGQSVSNSHITGADVSGTGTSSVEVHFEHCEIGAVTLGLFHMDESDIEGTVTLSATGTSFILGCFHAGTAVIDFGDSLASSTLHIHDYHGALTISEFGSTATDILHFTSPDGKLTMDSTCIGGTLNLNGTFDFVNNGSNLTINQDGRVSKAAVARVINPQVNTAFSNITFEMYDSTNHNPNTGLTVTGERSLDGGAYAGVSGTIAEISDGTYQIDATAADMNAALVVLRFSSSGADDTFVHIKTAA